MYDAKPGIVVALKTIAVPQCCQYLEKIGSPQILVTHVYYLVENFVPFLKKENKRKNVAKQKMSPYPKSQNIQRKLIYEGRYQTVQREGPKEPELIGKAKKNFRINIISSETCRMALHSF